MAQFVTKDYQLAHGRKPRGLRTWAFVPADYVWPGRVPTGAVAFVWGLYGDAKREIARQYPEIDRWTVLA